jgi:hypothetical protein
VCPALLAGRWRQKMVDIFGVKSLHARSKYNQHYVLPLQLPQLKTLECLIHSSDSYYATRLHLLPL